MIRTITRALGALALVGCGAGGGGGAAHPAAGRVTINSSTMGSGVDVARDGRIAYSKFVDGKGALFVADSDGSHARRVSFGNWDQSPKWSPDGKWIAFEREGHAYDVLIVPSDSGAERSVAETPADEQLAGWLPDGSGLIFTRSTARGIESWIYNLADGSSARPFEVEGSAEGFPSPDGRWIGYTRTRGGQSTIWVWDRQKRVHRQLTTEGFERASGGFSPDSRSVLYESRRTGTSDLWRVDVESGERRQLTQDIAYDGRGRWSPDGSRIAFLSDRGGQRDVWVLATGEGDAQRVTDDALPESDVVWTADGRRVLVYGPVGHGHLFALPARGGPAVQLTSGDWDVQRASVSPDRSQIAYAGTRNGDADIWTVPVNGGEPRLLSGAPGADVSPAWSPDGRRVAFMSQRAGSQDIWIASTDGAPAVQLTSWPSAENWPRWSPDGRTLAFLSDRGAIGADLWTIPAGGGAATRLTTFGTLGLWYHWSPDGKTIAFSAQATASGGIAIFTVPARGGEAKLIAPAWADGPLWSPDGRELAVARRSEGYQGIEMRSANGTMLRTLSPQADVYEFVTGWLADRSGVVIDFQDLHADGADQTAVRPTAGGATRVLAGPAGYSMDAIMSSAPVGATVIAIGTPNGTLLQRIDVPAAKRP